MRFLVTIILTLTILVAQIVPSSALPSVDKNSTTLQHDATLTAGSTAMTASAHCDEAGSCVPMIPCNAYDFNFILAQSGDPLHLLGDGYFEQQPIAIAPFQMIVQLKPPRFLS